MGKKPIQQTRFHFYQVQRNDTSIDIIALLEIRTYHA